MNRLHSDGTLKLIVPFTAERDKKNFVLRLRSRQLWLLERELGYSGILSILSQDYIASSIRYSVGGQPLPFAISVSGHYRNAGGGMTTCLCIPWHVNNVFD